MKNNLESGINELVKEATKTENNDNFNVPLHNYFKDSDESFRRNMLGRLDMDLGYYTGYGRYYDKDLWNQPGKDFKGGPEETVELMKGLYDSLGEKPKGMRDKILGYEKELKEPVRYNVFKHGSAALFPQDELAMKYERERYPRETNRRYNELLDDLERLQKLKKSGRHFVDVKGDTTFYD